MQRNSRRVKIFTWHIHGSYLFYLSKGPFEIYIPYDHQRSEGYIGRGPTFPFGRNVHEVPAADVKNIAFDCILFQTKKNFLADQYEILSEQQRLLPRVFLEHDPPQENPTDTRHVVNDPAVTLVHVTSFNKLMWNNSRTPVEVIDHGVPASPVSYSGELPCGIVVINNLQERGRRLGLDIFQEARKHVPLHLIGMNTEKTGGLGEILHPDLPGFISQYRFFFHPIRYTSLGLAVLEAMMCGMPVVGLATTELVTVIEDGRSGVLHTDTGYLIARMKQLLADKDLATRLGAEGKKTIQSRFSLQRFISDWHHLLTRLVEHPEVYSSNRMKKSSVMV